jgi:hypothetical protein
VFICGFISFFGVRALPAQKAHGAPLIRRTKQKFFGSFFQKRTASFYPIAV